MGKLNCVCYILSIYFFKEKLATAEEEVKRFNILLQETGTFRQIEEKEFGYRKEKKNTMNMLHLILLSISYVYLHKVIWI